MKYSLTFVLLLVFTICSTNIYAQRTCGNAAHMQELLEDAQYRKNHKKRQLKFKAINEVARQRTAICPDPVVLPMAVHYQGISNPDEACLTTLAQAQVQILNDDYQGVNADISTWVNTASASFPGVSNGESCIEFCLATQNHPSGYGLNNGDLAVTFNTTSGDSDANWAGYINIFVFEIGNGILGYSPLGGSGNGDGVAIDDQAFGSGAGCGVVSPGAPFNLGRTLTHELGHYLNLDHIWGGGCGSDDGIADTPDAADPNYGCPAIGSQSCNSNDLHMNYMDYTNDACMYMFSAGQSTRMENYTNANLQNVITKGQTVCAAPTCDDGAQNGDETGVDCGGSICPVCPSCTDGTLNGDELGVDCGGPDCPTCPTCTNGTQDGDEEGVDCGGTLCDACPTCDDGIQNQDETGVDCGGATCPECPVCTNVTLTIVLDNYPEETSWTLTAADGTTVDAGGTYGTEPDGSTLTFDYCLEAGCYDFTINDAFGDGMCCQYGNGSYTITDNDNGATLITGGEFGTSETQNFCVPDSTVLGCTDPDAHNYDPAATVDDGSCETCTDGILNGDETDVDCGGALCDACVVIPGCTDPDAHNYDPTATEDDGSCETCTDGILNGDETDVDCGGALCDACPTCDDGIQNQGETGVDCGGPNCAPCPACENITITINLDNYPGETSWTLVSADGTTIGSGGTYGNEPDGSTIAFDFCLDEGCYDFTINDSYGDGICCQYGQGSYSVVNNDTGATLASGGEFASTETTNLCITSAAVPGCTDPTAHNYDPAATEDDGSCETCIDGVLNGDETEIDCGGVLCDPCNETCPDTLNMSGPVAASGTEQANLVINSTCIINGTINVTYWAGDYILMNPGFEVVLGAEFLAEIQACVPLTGQTPSQRNQGFGIKLSGEKTGTALEFSLTKAEVVSIEILTTEGRKLVTVENKTPMAVGSHQLQLDELNLQPGLYLCKIKVGDTEQVIKVPMTR